MNVSKVIFVVLLVLYTSAIYAEVFNTITCGNNEESQKLIKLIQNHNHQKRENLLCNAKLNEIAVIKAKHIIANENIWHNAGHMSPNQLLRHHGFKLPKIYTLFGNQVEALAGGEKSAKDVFYDFLGSDPHRKLLLGDDDFFKSQDQIGAAFVKDRSTKHEYYWVVIIAGQDNHTIQQKPEVIIKPLVISKKKNRGRERKEKFYRDKVLRTIK